jgi:ribosomal protein L32
MARVTCRCGEMLKVKSSDADRLVCPRCGAKIRVHRTPSPGQGIGEADDGYLRFNCPCGRRLKVLALDRPEAGKCPDCGRVVPVPESAWKKPGYSSRGAGDQARPGRIPHEARTEDMDTADLARLERWAKRHLAGSNPDERSPGDSSTTSHQALDVSLATEPGHGAPPSVVKMEAGLRVCPRCGKPVHMSATVCRNCGEPVPKR